MEQLATLLHEVESSDLDTRPFLDDEHHPNVSVIRTLLETLFITPGGNIHLDACDDFRHVYGYELYPVERDGFGWVIGGVRTEKGTITFG